jgi:hypothetical protein
MPHGGTTNHVNGGPRGGNLQGSLRRASGVEGLTRNQNLAEKSRWTRRGKTGEGHTRCEYGLPQRVISGSVINTMRVTPREDAGLRLCPWKLDRQPSLFAYALLAVREASAAPLERGNKKSAVSRMLTEHGPTAPSGDSSQGRSQVPARDTAYCMSRTMISGLLAYTSLRTLSRLFLTFYLKPHRLCGPPHYALTSDSGEYVTHGRLCR